MKFHLQAYSSQDDFDVLPSITVSPVRCGDENCGELHGYSVRVGWANFGAALHMVKE